jgi:hypothetical protein
MGDDSKIIEAIEEVLKDGNKLDPEAASRLQLGISLENNKELLKINGRLKKVEEAADDWEENPSLLWLLRFETKKTVVAIILIFSALSILYVSGIRAPLFELLGLPPLIP